MNATKIKQMHLHTEVYFGQIQNYNLMIFNRLSIDFNGISTHLGLFYPKRLKNIIHIYIFCVVVSEEVFVEYW